MSLERENEELRTYAAMLEARLAEQEDYKMRYTDLACALAADGMWRPGENVRAVARPRQVVNAD